MKTIKDNVIFIADASHTVVYFNENAKTAFPAMELSKKYPDTTDSIFTGKDAGDGLLSSESITVFNFGFMRWLNFSIAQMEYPGHGLCNVYTGTFYNNLDREMMSRIKYMDSYDFAMEMNLTADSYYIISKQNFEKPIVFPEEPLSKLLKRTYLTMVHPDDHKKFWDLMNPETLIARLSESNEPLTDTIREKSSSGAWDNVKIKLIPQENQFNTHVMVLALFSIEKVNSRNPNQSSLEKDSLTGLFTTQSFITSTKNYLKTHSNEVCLISMDIEHFRFFNKWYSRWQGDRLLKTIAYFLHEMDRTFDTISGYAGGDNFYLLTVNQDSVLGYLVKGLNEIISSFDGIEGFRIAYGGYVFKDNTEDIMDAIDFATTATKRSLEKPGNGICWFDAQMIKEIEHDIQILPEIEKGLEENEFTFYLQPKCSISDNKIVGAEALIRWNNKIRGLISPAEFIPVLEKNGMIAKVDVYTWEKVCQTIRAWIDKGISPVPISVNVSRIDIFSVNVPQIFSDLVEKYKIDSRLIEIEITESAFVDDTRILHSVIQRLKDKGFAILIDDFGSGYSSLNMLKDVPADVLKMDIKFFDLDSSNFEQGVNVIRSVIDLSHNMKLPVIAEGVETKQQIDLLDDLGLNYVQGFYYYRPIPIIDYEKLISDKEKVSHSGLKTEQ